jgi:hypothetical protein
VTAASRAGWGGALWVVVTVWRVPNVLHPAWAHAILLFAALVIAPLLLEILARDENGSSAQEEVGSGRQSWPFFRWACLAQFPAALILVVACLRGESGFAAVLVLPWAGVLLCLAAIGFGRLRSLKRRSLPEICSCAGLIYSGVAAAWLLADRAGFRPLGFSPVIVLLTAVHFHFAGLLLPVLAGQALRQFPPSFFGVGVALAVIMGVPAVAVGITAAQRGAGSGFETIAAGLMALGGIGVAVFQVRLVSQSKWGRGPRACWLISALSLGFGMFLAATYGFRSVIEPWPWLDLPWMRALHGTVNAFGFGFCGVLGWFLVRKSRSTDLGVLTADNVDNAD